MNFNNEVYSSSSFHTGARVWINEVDSARNTNELKSSSSLLGRTIPDFEVLASKKNATALKKLLTAEFKRRVYMKSKRHNKTIDS